MARAMNVVALLVAVSFAGCMGESSDSASVEEAMNIAKEVNDQVQGAQTLLKEDEPTDTEDTAAPKDEKVMTKEATEDTNATSTDEEKQEAKAEDDAEEGKVEATVTIDAKNAHVAAKNAKQAAKVANTVARHSVKITEHAKNALKNAHEALHRARVNTEGLTKDQKNSLKKAEKKLHEATKDAEYGQVKDAKYTKAAVENKDLQKLEKKMDVVKVEKPVAKDDNSDELAAMQKELDELRKQLKQQGDDADSADDEAIKDLKKQIADMQKAEKKEDNSADKSHDEMKAEVERLRDMIKDLKEGESKKQNTDKVHKVPKTPSEPDAGDASGADAADAADVSKSSSLDIDTAMPYGELEPFGREDTAQELTENSIKESDGMVDQLEKAEVAEEKRAVFRALTRLRGAAITSYDGVARSQTGNIDEYNKMHQWRNSHPLHHLADEESDVTKWAFPENAD